MNEIVSRAMRARRYISLGRTAAARRATPAVARRSSCAVLLQRSGCNRATRCGEVCTFSHLLGVYEAPWLLQLLQDVCTSCAACAAALEGCSGDQSSGLRLLRPREQSCRHVLQLDVILCMPAPARRALNTWQVSPNSHDWLQMGCTAARACGVRLSSLWSSMNNPQQLRIDRAHAYASPRAHRDSALPERF